MCPSQILGEPAPYPVLTQVGRETHSHRARALSFQLINGTDGGISYTWSSMALQSDFLDGNMPMPIVTALERAPNNREQLIGEPTLQPTTPQVENTDSLPSG